MEINQKFFYASQRALDLQTLEGIINKIELQKGLDNFVKDFL